MIYQFERTFVLLNRLFSDKRILVVIGMGCGLLGIIGIFSGDFSYRLGKQYGIDVEMTSLLLILAFFTSFALLYLQSGGSESTDLEKIDRSSVVRATNWETRIIELERALENRNEISATHGIFSTDEKRELMDSIALHLSDEKISDTFEEKINTIRKDFDRSMGLERLSISSSRIVQRLQREITDLRLRSNVNLIIGMLITAGGLYLLWETIEILKASEILKTLATEGSDSDSKFVKTLAVPVLPRVLLVVFLEVFAYFFLKLYKNGLSEIKYFQNELTNVESKLAAVEFSYVVQNQEALKTSLQTLCKTERNFILEKGQTTVDLEKARSDSELTKGVIRAIPSLFKREVK